MRRALLLAVLVCGVLTPVAHAGIPFTVGEGQDPHLVVDGGGTAHVVWTTDTQIFYCQVPRGASACSAPPRTLDVGLEYGADSSFLLSGGGSTLYIVMPHYVNGRTYMWTSTDNGASWGPRTQIYKFGGGTDATEPVLGPQSGQLSVATWNPSSRAYGAALDGSEAETEATASLSNGGSSQYDLQVAPTGDGGLVAVSNDLASSFFFRMAPGSDPSDPAAWSGANPIGPGNTTRVAGGPGGAYVLATVPEAGGSAHQEIRKWTGSGFSAPFAIPEYGYINDIHVAPSGAVAAIFRENDDPNRLRMALSTDAGANYGLSTIAREDVVMDNMDIALAPDNQGWAVYEGGGGSTGARVLIRVVDTTPVADPASPGTSSDPGMVSPDPPSLRRVARDVRGAQLRLDVPGNCISPSTGRFQARLSVRRFPRRGTFVNVRRVDFYVGLRRVKRDRRAPFVQTITIRNPVAGRTYRLRTRAYIKRKRNRRLQRVTIAARVTVCTS